MWIQPGGWPFLRPPDQLGLDHIRAYQPVMSLRKIYSASFLLFTNLNFGVQPASMLFLLSEET